MDTKLWGEIAESTVDETVAKFEALEEELQSVNQMLVDLNEDNEELRNQIKQKDNIIQDLYSRLEVSFKSLVNNPYTVQRLIENIKQEIGE